MSSIIIRRQSGKILAELRYTKTGKAGRQIGESKMLGAIDLNDPACLLSLVLKYARKTTSIDRLYALRDAVKIMPTKEPRQPGRPRKNPAARM